jgi:hypothetical protein
MPFARALLGATAVLVLAACNETVKPKTTDRAAARVNGAEVALRPSAEALERAIDQEVIVQRALADGIDRDPEVANRLEAARRQVLTQAWFDRVGAGVAEVGDAEIREFRAHHPQILPGMDHAQAAPLIRKYLARQKRSQIAQAEVRKLRGAARIEYVNPPAIAGLF